MIEAAAQRKQQRKPLFSAILSWVQPRVMPYSVGAFASLLLFVGIIAALRPHLRALRDAELANRVSDGRYILANATSEGFYLDITRPVSPKGLAAVRAPLVCVESPSLNPRGALAALTMAPSHHHEGDDDMVVVTDVLLMEGPLLRMLSRPLATNKSLVNFRMLCAKTLRLFQHHTTNGLRPFEWFLSFRKLM